MKQIFKIARAFILVLALMVAFTFPAGAVYWDITGTNLLLKGFLELPEISTSTPGTPGTTSWRLYTYNDGVYVIDDTGSPTNLLASTTLDAAYTGGNTITLDASGDVELDLSVTARNVIISNTFGGIQAVGLEIDAETAFAVTDGLLFSTTAGTFTDAIDASDAGITNAINVGGNVIKGALASIDFTEFDVAAGTGSVTINDDGDLGALTVEGTVVDINSLDFVGVGEVRTGAATALTVNVDDGATAGEDLIVIANNIQITAGGAITISPDGTPATALGIDITDANLTNAISVGDNAILGTTGVFTYNNWDIAADGDATFVDGTFSGDVAVTGLISATTFAQDGIICFSSPCTFTVNGTGTGGVSIGTTSGTGVITLGNTSFGKEVILAAGVNLDLVQGDVTVVDTADSDLVTLTNNTVTSADLIQITSTGTRTSGAIINIVDTNTTTADVIVYANDALTSGNFISFTSSGATFTGAGLYMNIADSASFSGEYINLFDGSASDFTVKRYGATVIGGLANTDMFTITTGKAKISDGLLDVDTNEDHSSSFTRDFAGAGSAAVLVVDDTATNSTKPALEINQDGTGNSTGIKIVHDGDLGAITIEAGAARTGPGIDIATGNFLNQNGILIDGAWTGQAEYGMINLNPTGSIADGASAIFINTDTGTPGGSGFAIDVDDDSVDGGTLYAVNINSANNEGLHVELGVSLFVETATFTAQSVHTGGLDVNEDIDVDFDNADEEVSIINSAEYGADGAQVTIENTDADVGAAMYLLRLRYTDDGQANAGYMVFEDANGTDRLTIENDGDFMTEGTLTVNGAQIIGDGATEMVGVRADVVDMGAGPVTITAAMSGTVFYNSEASQGDLPADPTGLRYTFIVDHASQITIHPNGTDVIGHLTLGAGDKMTSSTVNDTVTLIGMDADTWYIDSIYPVAADWADGGA